MVNTGSVMLDYTWELHAESPGPSVSGRRSVTCAETPRDEAPSRPTTARTARLAVRPSSALDYRYVYLSAKHCPPHIAHSPTPGVKDVQGHKTHKHEAISFWTFLSPSCSPHLRAQLQVRSMTSTTPYTAYIDHLRTVNKAVHKSTGSTNLIPCFTISRSNRKQLHRPL